MVPTSPSWIPKQDDDHQSMIDHFLHLPYTRKTIEDPHFKIIPQSRAVTHNGRGHTLMGKTWNTESTIPYRLTLFRPSTSTQRAEERRLYTFGGDLNSHPHLLHGGVVGCILDSCIGGVVVRALAKQAGGPPSFTVQLNITYKKPIRTPGTVFVRSWVKKVEDGGRKAWAEGVIESEGGVVHALGEAMFVRPKARI